VSIDRMRSLKMQIKCLTGIWNGSVRGWSKIKDKCLGKAIEWETNFNMLTTKKSLIQFYSRNETLHMCSNTEKGSVHI